MKNIIKKLVIPAFICCLISCSDFLDVEPADTFKPEDVFTEIKLTEAYVNQRYTEVKDGLGTVAMRFASDEAYCTHSNAEDGAFFFNRGEVTPDQIGSYSYWKDYYLAIKNCNLFFENIHLLTAKDSKEQAIIDRLTGEAIFIRAYLYAELINRYGGVPIITKVFGLNDPEMMVPRDSYDKCVEFVITELDKAVALLPINHTTKEWGRATKGAALSVKSRILLYAASPQWNASNDRSKWQAAADAAWAVIDLKDETGNNVYSLHNSYKNVFLSNKNSEIIFWKQFSQEYGHAFDRTNSPNGYYGWSMTSLIQGMVDSYEMADGTMPSEDLYKGDKPWEGREPRFYASVVYDGSIYKDREVEFFISSSGSEALSGIDSEKSYIEAWNTSKSHYTIRKFTNEETSFPVAKSSQPWVYYRLGEIYLNYAEAKFQLGDEATARTYINLIRERAREGTSALPDITSSGTDLLAKMQHERKIELAFEDHRYFDVRRWKIAETTEKKDAQKITIIKDDNTGKKTYEIETLQERNFLPQHYLMPIPRSEIEKNPKLEQNSGYK